MSGGTTFNYTGATVAWVVPTTGTYDIVADGGAGGGGGGNGAEIGGDFVLTAGETLDISVGGAGGSGVGAFPGGGGGGGSFVIGPADTPLVIAGGGGGGGDDIPGGSGLTSEAGGGGSSTDDPGAVGGAGGTGGSGGGGGVAFEGDGGGGGGGGFSGSGTASGGGGGEAWVAGATGGAGGSSRFATGGNGGFGGGGGGAGMFGGGGGGGGYSGGGGGGAVAGGGGGGSFDGGTNQLLVAGENAGNGSVTIDPVCYLRGTRILTPAGEVPVETLRPGDLVTTVSGAQRPLRWIGFGRTLVTPRNRDRATPVVVRRHALAEFVPHRDLYVTRGHSLYLKGLLIPVEELINHRSIAWVEEARVVEYYHLELDSHDVVIAEGAAAESYREDDNSPLFHNAATRPATSPMAPYAPVLHDHPAVKRIWRELSERAGRLELMLTEDPDLHLLADGVRLDAERIEQRVWHFRLRGPVANLRIVSRSAIPSMIGLAQDQRRLGVALRRIVLEQLGLRLEVSWDNDGLVAGFHGPEPAECHRWTNGEGTLPEIVLPLLRRGATIELHVNGLLHYPLNPFGSEFHATTRSFGTAMVRAAA